MGEHTAAARLSARSPAESGFHPSKGKDGTLVGSKSTEVTSEPCRGLLSVGKACGLAPRQLGHRRRAGNLPAAPREHG